MAPRRWAGPRRVTNRTLRRLLQGAVAALLLVGLQYLRTRSDGGRSQPASTAPSVMDAFRARRSGVEIETGGRVTRVLADDRQGSRHQRFLIRVVGTVSVLVAHNIDLAPRVPVAAGDSVELRGEYEWNERGGVLHWTHRDPAGHHPPGWIRHEGRLYE